MADILAELQPIFRDVLDDRELQIQRDSAASNVEGWDSFAHLNLIAAIEEHFDIRFSLPELEAMKNVGEMADLVEKKVAK